MTTIKHGYLWCHTALQMRIEGQGVLFEFVLNCVNELTLSLTLGILL